MTTTLTDLLCTIRDQGNAGDPAVVGTQATGERWREERMASDATESH